jgi:type IV pilus assembly protein PilB
MMSNPKHATWQRKGGTRGVLCFAHPTIMPRRKRLGEILLEACLINEEQLEQALRLQQKDEKLLGQILVDMGWVSEQEVCRAVAELLHVKYVEVEDVLISQEVVQLAPEDLAAKRNILPLFIQDKTLYVAMENPMDIDIIQRIEFKTGMQVKPLIAPPSQLRQTVRKHYNVDEYVGRVLGNVIEENAVSVDAAAEAAVSDETVDVSEVRKISEGSQVVKLANLVISEGIKKRASDIHIEPGAKCVNVRYRIDGMLTRGIQVPNWLKLPLISRLKIIAGMDIAEHRKPQDGRIGVSYEQRKIDLRVSTLLTNFGEKVVIRILDSKTSSHDLSRLGLSDEHLRVFRMLIQQPQGWILVTGPTGSGKTTTLYASLNAMKDVTKNIVTVEDPIEYQLEGINQVQVNPKAGLTFASGLRSILRQDPNVILVGEIRDAETAGIAMQASETGHLVLSTLHTNDSVSTVNRLFNLGLSPDLVAANLLVVAAQRLVRCICPHCKTAYTPDRQELQSIGIQEESPGALRAYRGQGCPACKQTGYHGQIGLYELFVPNDQIREAIAQRPTKHALKKLATDAGMQTMLDDGIAKMLQGVTTIAEVARVCYVEPDEAVSTVECPKCGAAVAETEPVCPECQYQMYEACSQCGAKLESAWRLCPFCGTVKPGIDVQPLMQQRPSAGWRPALPKDHIRVVIADDEPPVRDMVRLLLEGQGYQVISAADGEEALGKIRDEQPDLVVLDVVMPKRDGFSVCKAVRSSMETMFIPIMMLTGQDSVEEKLRGLSYGADDYITKPFNADELLARIESVLRRSYHSA